MNFPRRNREGESGEWVPCWRIEERWKPYALLGGAARFTAEASAFPPETRYGVINAARILRCVPSNETRCSILARSSHYSNHSCVASFLCFCNAITLPTRPILLNKRTGWESRVHRGRSAWIAFGRRAPSSAPAGIICRVIILISGGGQGKSDIRGNWTFVNKGASRSRAVPFSPEAEKRTVGWLKRAGIDCLSRFLPGVNSPCSYRYESN